MKILSYTTPEVTVQFSNISVDAFRKQFTLTLGTKEKGKRKFTERQISGSITKELASWLSELTPEVVKVKADNEEGFIKMKTGRKLTGFQKYLIKRELELFNSPLRALTFTADNNSEDYASNPFRLVCYANGHNTLTLVRARSMKVVERLDTTTGEVHKSFYNQTFVDDNGITRKSFNIPKFYRRLILQQEVEVELHH